MTSPHLIELLPEVSAFLQRRHGLWIDGGWQSASAPADTPVRNPATGDIISFVSDASAESKAIKEVGAAIDTVAATGATAVYVEIEAVPAQRKLST